MKNKIKNISSPLIAFIPLDELGEPLITDGMNEACIGEFAIDVEYFNDEGTKCDVEKHAVDWATCKEIYKAMAKIAIESIKE